MTNLKDVKDYEGRYAVTSDGQVYSYLKKKYLKPETTNNGYQRVCLTTGDGRKKHELIHRLVAIAFLDNPERLPCVNHKNGDRQDNRVENLEWCSYQYNNTFGDRLQKSAAKHSKKVKQMTMDGEFIRYWDSAAQASRELNISNVYRAANGTRKSVGGFRWEYVDQEVTK